MERKLTRSEKNKVVAGVCGGIGEYFNLDPAIVRIIWIILFFADGVGLLAYIIAAIIMPKDRKSAGDGFDTGNGETADFGDNSSSWKETGDFGPDRSRIILGAGIAILGVMLLAKQFFNWIDFHMFWPVILILIGAVFIWKGRRDSF